MSTKNRAYSSPELMPPGSSERQDDLITLEGISTSVKLLAKLIQDHNEACQKDDNARKSQRIAGMISILDDVKSRLEKSQPPQSAPSCKKPSEAELRRCNTDLRRAPAPKVDANLLKQPLTQDTQTDENDKLRKQLSASLAARKSLEKMFSSLGKEKEIMAAELARKVHELSGMEEHLNDLRAQNEKLLEKAKVCAAEHKERKPSPRESQQGNQALQERNKILSEQLLKSIDVYRVLKRKYKEKQADNARLRATVGEITEEVVAGLQRVLAFRAQAAGAKERRLCVDMEEELCAVEHIFRCLEAKAAASTLGIDGNRSECAAKPKAEISTDESPVAA